MKYKKCLALLTAAFMLAVSPGQPVFADSLTGAAENGIEPAAESGTESEEVGPEEETGETAFPSETEDGTVREEMEEDPEETEIIQEEDLEEGLMAEDAPEEETVGAVRVVPQIGESVGGKWKGLLWRLTINEASRPEEGNYSMTLTVDADWASHDRSYETSDWSGAPWRTNRIDLSKSPMQLTDGQQGACISEFVDTIAVGDGVTYIGPCAFDCMSKMYRDEPGDHPRRCEIILGKDIREIGRSAFFGCNMTDIILPDGLLIIGNGAFACNKFTSVEIPGTVISLGAEAFACNDKLTSITVPRSVVSIGKGAFQWDSALKEAYVKNGKLSDYEFAGCPKLKKVVIGSGSGRLDACAAEFPFDGDEALLTLRFEKGTFWDNVTGNNYEFLCGGSGMRLVRRPEDVEAKCTKDGIKVTWSPSVGFVDETDAICKIIPQKVQYRVYRESKAGNYCIAKIQGKASGQNSFLDTTTKPGAVYTYRITAAYNGYNETPKPCSSVSMYLKGTSFSGASKNGTSAVLKWPKVSGVRGYKIVYSTDGNFKKGVQKLTVAGDKTGTTIQGLKKGKTYYFKIQTYQKVDTKYYYSIFSGKKAVKF